MGEQHQGSSCLTSSSTIWRMWWNEQVFVKFADGTKLAETNQHIWGQGCHLERPQQIGVKDWQKLHKIQWGQTERPAAGKEENLAPMEKGTDWLGTSTTEKDMVDRERVKQHTAVCPAGRGSQQHPGLYSQERSHKSKGSDHPFYSDNLLDHI